MRAPAWAPRREGRGLAGDLLFGVGYGTASLSCTLPIFLAAIGTALTGSLAGSALSFLAYAAGMGTVLTALAVAAALSWSGLALLLRRLLPHMRRASGALLCLAGAYVVYYWAFFLLADSGTGGGGGEAIDQGQRLAARLAGWLGGSEGQQAVEGALAAIALLLLGLVARRLGGGARAPGGSTSGRKSCTVRHVSSTTGSLRGEKPRRRQLARLEPNVQPAPRPPGEPASRPPAEEREPG